MTLKGETKGITLNRLVPGGKTYSRWNPEKLKGLCWAKSGCLYVRDNTLYKVRLQGRELEHTLLFSLARLNSFLKKHHLPAAKKLPLPIVPSSERAVVVFETPAAIVWFDTESASAVQTLPVNRGWKNRTYLPFSSSFLCTYKNNLWKIGEGIEQQLTFEENPDIVIGEPAHRNEWGIEKGVFLSPSGTKAAFYRADTSKESRYYFAANGFPKEKQDSCLYPYSGQPNPPVTVGVADLEKGAVIYLQTPAPAETYFAGITWSGDEKNIFVTEVERSQQHCRLCRYNAKSGAIEAVLFNETASTYVEPMFSPMFVRLPDGSEGFVWASRKDGWQHLYLYNREGQLIRQLTAGEWEVTALIGQGMNGDIFYLSTEISPLEQNLYAVSTEGEKRAVAPFGGVVLKARLSGDGAFIVNEFSTPQIPRRIDWIALAANETFSLYKAGNTHPEVEVLPFDTPLRYSEKVQVYTGSLPAADNKTPLYYRLSLPAGFDAGKKYPAIQYVYGGPHVQLVSNTWLYNAQGWEIYLASRGYAVFTLDARGSKNRGQAYEQSIFRRLGSPTDSDLIAGTEWLRKQPFVDAGRVGIYGWSFGGYMALRLLLNYSGYFKAGVAGGAVTNWRWYESMYTERYMQTPEKNPEGYDSTDLTRQAAKLNTPLLLIHGDRDPVVLPQHLFGFVNACTSEGKQPTVTLYPKQGHNVEGKERVHLFRQISEFFDKEL